MQKFFGLVLLAALIAGRAPAQTSPAAASPAADRSAEQQATNQTQRLAREIGLAPAQLPPVRQILLATSQEMKAAREQALASGDQQSLRPAMQAARAKADAQLHTVLTPAQFAKYQQLLAARIGQLHTTGRVGAP